MPEMDVSLTSLKQTTTAMPKKLTRGEFIERLRGLPAEKLDLSQFEYKGLNVKSTAVCQEHGAYQVSPASLFLGSYCPKCSHTNKDKVLPFPEFKKRAEVVHNSRYSYDESSYTKSSAEVSITCPDHGPFKQIANAHLSGRGCYHCGKIKAAKNLSLTQEDFIRSARAIHGDKYDFSKSVYVGSKTDVEVICKKHGSFFVKPNNLISSKTGCPKCANEMVGLKSRLSDEEWIARAKAVHGDKYTYNSVDWECGKAHITYSCPKHGMIRQNATDHVRGVGCRKCYYGVYDTDSFIAKAREVHGDKYDYSKVVYTAAHDKVLIICPTHGEFTQGATYHVNNKHGCPTCGKVLTSKGQCEISAFAKNYTHVVDNFVMRCGRHIDIYMPSINAGIEYHGLIWHSEKFTGRGMKDYAKHKSAAAEGIRIVHVYADEWNFRQHVVEAMIKRMLGVVSDKVYARKCSVELVSERDASAFLEDTHIQGAVGAACSYYGLTNDEKLVAVMAFSRVSSIRGTEDDGETVELRRFATCKNVVGGASKLLAAFLRGNPNVKRVISYSDNRMFAGGMYEAIGFRKESVSEPSYSYVNSSVPWREGKHRFTRSRMVGRKEFKFDPTLSERENCEANGWYRIYDCGKTKWVYEVQP